MTTSYAKIEITGTLTVLTGLQIGAGDGFSAIGAVDKPVVRDPLSRLPMIPGTSLKGKVRTCCPANTAPTQKRFTGSRMRTTPISVGFSATPRST